jgi:hypothetical protein
MVFLQAFINLAEALCALCMVTETVEEGRDKVEEEG